MGNDRSERGGRDWRDPREPRYGGSDERSPRHPGGREERGFFERAGDEISSWFGDDEAERRRAMDERGAGDGRPRRPMDEQGRHERPYNPDEGYRRPYTGRSDHESAPRPRGDERGYRPMTGDYGRSVDERERSSGTARSGPPRDRHYDEWRRQQIEALDRDYDEYRQENQSKFDSDFSQWRSTRQAKRQMLGSIAPHMHVVGSDDQPLGTVDKVRGDRIILTKSDSPDGHHHSIGCALIDRVEGDRVILDRSADAARAASGDEVRDRALFERDENREPGPHILDRSFSGTY